MLKTSLLAKTLLGLLFITSIVLSLRYPFLLSSEGILTSIDEAPHAWLIKSLMDGAPLFFYFSDINYHGITIGLAAIPFFWMLGVNALAYKLPAIMFHSLYILTSYFIARRIDKKIGLLVVFLLLLPSPYFLQITTNNWPHHVVALFGNIIFLILMELKQTEQKPKKGLVFLFFLIAGFSIYTYTYSILFIFSSFVLFALTHTSWGDVRSRLQNFKSFFFTSGGDNQKLKIVRTLDIIILLFLLAILFSYVFGGFGLDIAGISIFQINKLHKPVFQLLILIAIRCLIYRRDLKEKLNQSKQFLKRFDRETKSLIIISLSGLTIGLFPRLLSIILGQVKRGGQGFDIDFSPIKLALHFQGLFTTTFPNLLGLREHIHALVAKNETSAYSLTMAGLSVALLGLFLAATFSFFSTHSKSIKKIFKAQQLDYKPELILIILFFTVCGANIISQTGPLSPRYIYPLYMVLIIWLSLFLKKIRKKSSIAYILILLVWSGFYLTQNYEKMTDSLIMKDFKVVNRKEPLNDVIKFCRSKNIEVAYGDFSHVYKANFLGDNSPFFIEYLTKPKYYSSGYFQAKAEQSRSQSNFAVVTDQDDIESIYLKYLLENKVAFNSTAFDNYTVYYDFKGRSSQIEALRILMDKHYIY